MKFFDVFDYNCGEIGFRIEEISKVYRNIAIVSVFKSVLFILLYNFLIFPQCKSKS